MKREYIFLGCIFIVIVMFFMFNKTDVYGEYSTDGKPRYNIKIMDNDKAKLIIDNQIVTVNYEEQNDRLELVQDDVYRVYREGVTEVYFEPQKDDKLLYNVVQNGEKITIGEYKKIEGSNGDSGEPSVFWLTIKSMFYGLVIFGVIMAMWIFIFSYIRKKNDHSG
ncbi:hypothetical protein OCF65_28665 [Bacillus toyonensis]|uniref:hypothetical protein n=1 Tax=Bacillus toyonensis TaxID=155322 RepID=UPI0006AA1472|nr:hypothetical protein [Bacillus toyonensis]MCU5584339.1 hypothetical protein [Bacillus toyonensis]OKO50538.1 hypothetical protein ABH17_029195 [Bacillus toyonensis]UFI00571.1 hypothetical protein HQN46_0028100 [Bacillus toyonensis]